MKKKIEFIGIIAIVAIIGFLLSSCGDSSSGDPSTPGHSHTWNWTINPSEATCTATGNTGEGFCTGCTETKTNQIIPSIGHTGNWVLQTPVSYCVGNIHNTGTEKRTCSVCSDIEIRTTLSCLGTEGLVFTVEQSKATVGDNRSIAVTSVCIPAYYDGYPVVRIIHNAFNNCTGLANIIIPNSVISIGNHAFYNTGLTSITIPDSVTSIESRAFQNCSSLTSVIIPDSVSSIGEGAFSVCENLQSITVDTGNQYFSSQDGILYDKAKTTLIQVPGDIVGSVTIPDSVISIRSGAFYRCTKVVNVTIGNDVASIGDYVFEECFNLKSITVVTGNQYYSSQDGILYDKAKTIFVFVPGITGIITIPYGITSIDRQLFRSFNIESITIPDSVISIGEAAFFNCDNLTSVTIGSGVTSIETGAFVSCDILVSVTINAIEPPTLGVNVFASAHANLKIFVPASSVTEYKSTVGWSDYADIIVAITP